MSAGRLNTLPKHFPIGYFKSHENQKNFLFGLGNKLNFTTQTDWYKLSARELRSHGGGRMLLSHYKDSLAGVVMGVFNDEAWRPWLFKSRAHLEWAEPLRLQYMEYLYQQLGFKTTEDWYTISCEDVLAHHGALLLQKFGNSPSRMVMGILSDHPWQFWMFSNPPRYVWDDQHGVRQYIKYLGEQLDYKRLSDWYHISTRAILAHHGEPLLRKHGRSPARMITQSMPDHPWLPFLFQTHARKQRTSEMEKYAQRLEEQMGVKRREEWYEVTRGDVGEEVRLHFNDIGDLVANVLQVAYPDHGPWDLGKFTNFSKSTTQHKMKELLTREFPDAEVIENYPHPFQFFPHSGEIMTVDVFVPSLNLALDYNGEQHYKQVSTSRSVIERQKIDAIKREEFKKIGCKFVVVPCWWDGTMASLLPNIPPTPV